MQSGTELADLHVIAADIGQFSSSDDEIAKLLTHRAMGFTCMIQGKLEKAYEELIRPTKLALQLFYARNNSLGSPAGMSGVTRA